MKLTISAIGAQIGSIAGLAPSERVLAAIRGRLNTAKFRCSQGLPLIADFHVSYIGDGVSILMTHFRGVNDSKIQELALEALQEAAGIAAEQGLCGAVQCINLRAPTLAEMSFDDRPGQGVLLFAADDAEPKAFIRRLRSAAAAGVHQAVASAGRVMLVRTGMDCVPASEVLSTFADPRVAVMPVPMNTPGAISVGLPLVSCAAFSVRGGRLTEPVDCFASSFWNVVRDQALRGRRTHSAVLAAQTA